MDVMEKPKSSKDKSFDDWELESKAKMLLEAEEIKSDAKLMKALQPYLARKIKAYKSLSDLKADAGLDGSVNGSEED